MDGTGPVSIPGLVRFDISLNLGNHVLPRWLPRQLTTPPRKPLLRDRPYKQTKVRNQELLRKIKQL